MVASARALEDDLVNRGAGMRPCAARLARRVRPGDRGHDHESRRRHPIIGTAESGAQSACVSCRESACRSQLAACQASPDCARYLACVQGCPADDNGTAEVTCARDCAATDAATSVAAQALQACESTARCPACLAGFDAGYWTRTRVASPTVMPETRCASSAWRRVAARSTARAASWTGRVTWRSIAGQAAALTAARTASTSATPRSRRAQALISLGWSAPSTAATSSVVTTEAA
jgi:hypothetical protein